MSLVQISAAPTRTVTEQRQHKVTVFRKNIQNQEIRKIRREEMSKVAIVTDSNSGITQDR